MTVTADPSSPETARDGTAAVSVKDLWKVFGPRADKIVGSKLLNCGHICAAPQVLILPQDWAQAVNCADAALYEAKSSGRDRLVEK